MSDGDFLRKIGESTGTTPSAIAHQPSLDLVAAFFWEAYHVLALSRTATGFGPGPIPLSEIRSYAELMEIPSGDEQRDLVHLIRRMDVAYLDHVAKRKHG